jgi:hypothetical protein
VKASLFLLDTDPLLDFVEGRLHSSRNGELLNRAWLGDRCYFCPLSLFATPLPRPDGSARRTPPPEWARHQLLQSGLREITISWETLLESAGFREFPPMSYEWLLLGVAAHLDATLISARPNLMWRRTEKAINRLAWSL